MSKLPCFAAPLSALALVCLSPPARAVLFSNFSEFGTTVNGYQDDFNGTTLSPDWFEYNAGPGDPPHFSLSGLGSLMMHAANGDPNKLLYNPVSGYDSTTQNVLALIRMTTEGPNIDGGRGGLAAVSNTFDGQGLNLHIRQPGQNGPGNHFNLLDDARAWGPSTDPGAGGASWVIGEYQWLRLVVDASGVPSGKIWPAGGTPEPAGFNLTWDARGRAGLAGLTTNSIGGANEFEVDYFLVQASGLPSIQVVPEPATGMLGLMGVAAFGLARRRRPSPRRTR
jgi:MYXO-CTERM domain-containing protein